MTEVANDHVRDAEARRADGVAEDGVTVAEPSPLARISAAANLCDDAKIAAAVRVLAADDFLRRHPELMLTQLVGWLEGAAAPAESAAPDLVSLREVCAMTGFLEDEVLGCWRANRQTAPIAHPDSDGIVSYPRSMVEAWMSQMGLTPKSAYEIERARQAGYDNGYEDALSLCTHHESPAAEQSSCPSWCIEANCDGDHQSDLYAVEASAHAAFAGHTGGHIGHPVLYLRASSNLDGNGPAVCLTLSDGNALNLDVEVFLLPGQARELRDHLEIVLDLVDAGQVAN